jgi:hypothetical protein
MGTDEHAAYSAVDLIMTGLTRLEIGGCISKSLQFIEPLLKEAKEEASWGDEELDKKCVEFWAALVSYAKALANDAEGYGG